MFTTLIITLREGLEAFLIVAITLTYLRKTGRNSLASAVYWGTGVALIASFVAALFFREAENKPLWEGTLALVAAVSVVSLVIYMWRNGKKMRQNIAARIETVAHETGAGAWLGIFAFVLLMIVREGMETALILSALAFQESSRMMFAGALLGVAAAGAIAWAWSRYGHRVNIGRFLQVTALFLLLFVVQLLVYSFHEFTEAYVLPIDNEFWHIATEPYGPEGIYGQMLTYSMVLVPTAWLFFAWLQDRLHPTSSKAI